MQKKITGRRKTAREALPMKSEQVVRHSLTVRINHWLIAISGIALLFSGMGQLPMYKRYNVTKIPGLEWSADFEITLVMHYIAAIVFAAAALFHVVYHVRRKEFAIWPRRGDLRESVVIIRAMLNGKPEPPHGKFLAEQRIVYVVVAFVSFVLLVTGSIKAYKNTGNIVLDPTFLEVVTLLHTGFTMLFMFLLFAHLAAFVLKANRPLFPSMFHGKVSRKYAEERHGKWKV